MRPIATNTILLTNLPSVCFKDDGEKVKSLLSGYGNVKSAVLLKSFSRILAVFQRTADAQHARRELHLNPILGPDVRVYYGEHTDDTHLLDPSAGTHINYLQVPELERNFLLSPPGSPPVDWVQIREAGPASGGHSQALLNALKELEHDDFMLEMGARDDGEQDVPLSPVSETYEEHALSPGRQMLVFKPPSLSLSPPGSFTMPESLPVVIVEDTEESQSFNLKSESLPVPTLGIPAIVGRQHGGLPKTAMPPAPSR
ncbi:Calcipressin-domain-containing protein [Fimicolochytrium jonesii]|uniref:Calcipressin-domain-containing protein n=1 Tax=Fimicolochytrium jonesii TaxID=1396493 RepID=UPI0022FE0C1F|nr:Calcipressin-domain-containing protein [Fimicolochytrium jonesii]KAI8825999.1 Calcipressin-domain-containing protein [Fimicolochytrium jonesii]